MGSIDNKKQEEYIKGWTQMMITIWSEKIVRYGVIDTGKLHASLAGSLKTDTVSLKFLSYGLYAAYGVGNGYKRGNNGYLKILDKEYRKEHKLGRTRKRRNWFTPRLYSSVKVLQKAMAEMYSRDALAVVCNALVDKYAILDNS